MKWKYIKELGPEAFRRLTGVKQATFEKVVKILEKALTIKKAQGGRPNKLSIEDMLLMTLEYLREYRTYFHISQSYGVSESSAYKTICWVDDTLIKQNGVNVVGIVTLIDETLDVRIDIAVGSSFAFKELNLNRKFTLVAQNMQSTSFNALVYDRVTPVAL